MAYAEQGMSRGRVIALVITALLHVGLGYALISGLALKAVKVITGPLESVNIEDEAPPPEEPPPPPPKELEIPPYVPPPDVTLQTEAPPPPTITTQTVVAQPEPPRYVAPSPPAPVAAPTPAPAGPTVGATLRSKSMSITEDDYPDASRRAEEQGSTRVSFAITADGRVETCNVVASSGHPRLDDQTCKIILRRWRFNPAQQNGVAIASTKTQSVRWQLTDSR